MQRLRTKLQEVEDRMAIMHMVSSYRLGVLDKTWVECGDCDGTFTSVNYRFCPWCGSRFTSRVEDIRGKEKEDGEGVMSDG